MSVVYKYEEISGKHFVKIADLVSETQVQTRTASLKSILSGEVQADNLTVANGKVIFQGQPVASSDILLQQLKQLRSVQIGKTASGQPIMINNMGMLSGPNLNNVGQVVSGEIPAKLANSMLEQTKHQPSVATHHANDTSAAVESLAQQLKTTQSAAPTQQVTPTQSVTEADKKHIDELTDKLNKARDDYYNTGEESMTNFEYDKLFDELVDLEKKTGYSRPDSPTKSVGAEVKTAGNVEHANKGLKQGTKVAHEEPALSLGKTKSVEDLKSFLGDKVGVLSVKMDGLTVVLTYDGGELQYAVTRGNGTIGEIVTQNVANMIGVPAKIGYPGKLILRGEAYMTYSSYNAVNANLPAGTEPFKNPRNLAAGTLRTFDNPQIAAERQLRFCAFEIVNWEDIGLTTAHEMLDDLPKVGFSDTVKHVRVDAKSLSQVIETFTDAIKKSDLPADGLVLRLDDLEYGQSLGNTGRTPRHSMAFKWEDAEVETELINIEWTVGRTGIITPTAVFKPVDLEGSTIQKASLHNISMMEQILGQPYVGQKIWVYKANMIIPQVSKAVKLDELNAQQPETLQLTNDPRVTRMGNSNNWTVQIDGDEVVFDSYEKAVAAADANDEQLKAPTQPASDTTSNNESTAINKMLCEAVSTDVPYVMYHKPTDQYIVYQPYEQAIKKHPDINVFSSLDKAEEFIWDRDEFLGEFYNALEDARAVREGNNNDCGIDEDLLEKQHTAAFKLALKLGISIPLDATWHTRKTPGEYEIKEKCSHRVISNIRTDEQYKNTPLDVPRVITLQLIHEQYCKFYDSNSKVRKTEINTTVFESQFSVYPQYSTDDGEYKDEFSSHARYFYNIVKESKKTYDHEVDLHTTDKPSSEEYSTMDIGFPIPCIGIDTLTAGSHSLEEATNSYCGLRDLVNEIETYKNEAGFSMTSFYDYLHNEANQCWLTDYYYKDLQAGNLRPDCRFLSTSVFSQDAKQYKWWPIIIYGRTEFRIVHFDREGEIVQVYTADTYEDALKTASHYWPLGYNVFDPWANSYPSAQYPAFYKNLKIELKEKTDSHVTLES